MRKLTVKNFSVIKEAELEFGKITVLIGPQSSGKSLLCKLAYFLGKVLIDIAAGRAANNFDLAHFEASVKVDFLKWFPSGGWGQERWSIVYVSNQYEVCVKSPHGMFDHEADLDFEFCTAFIELYAEQSGPYAEGTFRIPLKVKDAFRKLMGKGSYIDFDTYIPAGRSYFVDLQKGYKVLANEADPLTGSFAESYATSLQVNVAWPAIQSFLKGKMSRGSASWLFVFDDGRTVPLELLSSGSQELLPLICVLEMYARRRIAINRNGEIKDESPESFGDDEFFVEEPEAHIFPKTQYELVQFFTQLTNNKACESHFTITTHSPYVLTAFNSLIEAWHAGNKPGKRELANAIISERYWVDPDEFKAYAIHDGVLVSIFKKEGEEGAGLIDGDYLDSVSDQLGSEFEKLLDIEYAG